ncbi:S8 family serine peptidase [Candidatus Woesearchaeota archaeon]|nr:S8 family serine peptidase [Candidatus Woesearchaeota archaeon]
MPKKILLFLLSMLLVNTVQAIHIDDEVEERLDSDEEVSVIVILKDEPVQEPRTFRTSQSAEGLPKQGLKTKKAMIGKQQDKVLSGLDADDDLKLKHRYSTFNGFSGKLTTDGLRKLKNNPDVEKIFFDKTLQVTLDSSIPQVNANDMWGIKLNGINITGAGETICVIDTGIDTGHSAFTGRILGQYCYCSISDYGSGGCCPNNQTEDTDVEDDYGHGTHCAGIAAGDYPTYTGVAPGAGIIVIKACNSTGNCAASDVSKGIDWCTNNASEYNISVTSISIGGGGPYNNYCNADPLAPSINSAAAQNILVAIAAGNNGYTNGIHAPACVENATPVGTVTDADDSLLHNRGNILELIAPGQTITAPYIGGGTTSMSGTSMAAPHVAGAAALIKQFMKLWNSTAITPGEIEDIFNNTGKRIYDSGSSRYYSRLDIYAAVISQDTTPPDVVFVSPTPDNNTITANTSILINVTVNDNLTISSCLLEWNSTNESMTKVGTDNDVYCYKNKSIIGAGTFYYRIYANDSSGNDAVTELRQITITNTAPNIISFYPAETTFNISEPNNQTFNITYTDINNDPVSVSWYRNGTLVSSLDNYTFYGNYSTEGVYNITAIIGDGTLTDTQSWNLTVSNTTPPLNTAPVLAAIANVTVNETQLINITANATDADNDTLTYAINDTRFTKTNNHFTWQTQLGDAGAYMVRINITDGTDSDYQDVKITVIQYEFGSSGGPDFDGDGIPDANDTDDDNDGLEDTIDFLTGNATNINSTVAVKLRVNGSENLTRVFNETLPVNVTDADDNPLLEFNWNFNSQTLVVNWTIDYNSTGGTIRIKDLDLTSAGITKTVYINKSDSSYNHVCIADDETTQASSLPSDCSGYTLVECSGSKGQYHCTDLTSTFEVSGLNHSAVRGIYVVPEEERRESTIDSSGGGGGGGSTGGPAYTGSTTKKTIVMMDLKPDQIYRIDLNLANLALIHNYFSVNKPLPQVKITMELVDDNNVESPLENAYQYFRITTQGMTRDDLNSAELEFRISDAWLRVKGYSENMVALNLYDNAWRKLPTYRSGSYGGDIFFVSNINSFGYFAITSESAVIMEEPGLGEETPLEITGAVTKEDKSETWKDGLPVIKLTRKEYLTMLGLATFIATLVIISLTLSRMRSPYPKLSKYVKLSFEHGQKKSKIRKTLIETGWPKHIVDYEINKYEEKCLKK